jgi:hypothetical protein
LRASKFGHAALEAARRSVNKCPWLIEHFTVPLVVAVGLPVAGHQWRSNTLIVLHTGTCLVVSFST